MRRNEEYNTCYNFLASYLNKFSAGIPFYEIGSCNKEKIIKFDIIEAISELPLDHHAFALNLFLSFIFYFKMSPPLNPSEGISSAELLKIIIEDEFARDCADEQKKQDGMLKFKNFLIPEYVPYPSTIILKNEIDNAPSLEEKYLIKRNQAFLDQNPQFERDIEPVTDSQESSFNEVFRTKGKYEYLAMAPKKLITKDRKAIVAMEKYLRTKSKEDFKNLCNALTKRTRQTIKIKRPKRRVKRRQLLRAAGLYLWDEKQKTGALKKSALNELNKNIIEQYEDLYEKYGIDIDTNLSLLQDERFPYKLVRETEHCIQKGEFLPILK